MQHKEIQVRAGGQMFQLEVVIPQLIVGKSYFYDTELYQV